MEERKVKSFGRVVYLQPQLKLTAFDLVAQCPIGISSRYSFTIIVPFIFRY